MEKLTQGAPRLHPQLLHFIMFLTLQGGHFNAFVENGLTLGTSLASARPEDLIKEAHARPIKYQTTGSMTQAASFRPALIGRPDVCVREKNLPKSKKNEAKRRGRGRSVRKLIGAGGALCFLSSLSEPKRRTI